MIEVNFKRFTGKHKIHCESCGKDIKENQPFFELYFKKIFKNIYVKINLCEDCGQDLQNDMSDEYHKFVDLGK